MSRKHNTKHNERSQSRYPERLRRRGMTTKSARMAPFDTPEARRALRKRTGTYDDSQEYNNG